VKQRLAGGHLGFSAEIAEVCSQTPRDTARDGTDLMNLIRTAVVITNCRFDVTSPLAVRSDSQVKKSCRIAPNLAESELSRRKPNHRQVGLVRLTSAVPTAAKQPEVYAGSDGFACPPNPLSEIRFLIPFDRIVRSMLSRLLKDTGRKLAHALRAWPETAPRHRSKHLPALDSMTDHWTTRGRRQAPEGVATYPELRAAFNAVEPWPAEFYSDPLDEGLWKALRVFAGRRSSFAGGRTAALSHQDAGQLSPPRRRTWMAAGKSLMRRLTSS